MAGSLTLIATIFTKLHLLQVQMLHDIIIQNQELYTEFAFSRLAIGTFRNALSRMSIERRVTKTLQIYRHRKDYPDELPATRDQ